MTNQVPKLFDFVKDISFEKKHLLRQDNFNELNFQVPVICLAFSMGVDTVLYANELNKRPDISKLMAYDYLFHSLKKANRFVQWKKKRELPDVSMLMEFFGYSEKKAREAQGCLSVEQLEQIRKSLDKGGRR